ncbi:MAG: GAF domain-containing protein, partial [Sulfuriferula sp.]
MRPTYHGRYFSAYLWLTLSIYIVLMIAFAVYIRAEKATDNANELRLQSYSLADQLRQSSDDLTRMARAYAATGNPIYKQHYQEILDIRNGKRARPEYYENVYWDLVQTDNQRPRPSSGQPVALLDLMRQAHFTDAEFAKLALAKANSDALTQTEFAAFQLIEKGGAQSVAGIHTDALAMLHSPAYYQHKADIMRPIGEFQQMMTTRTTARVEAAKATATRLRWLSITLGLALLYALWRIYRNMRRILGNSLDEVHQQVARLAQGNFYPPIRVPSGMDNSIIGWLADTQNQLNKIDTANQIAQAQTLRMTNLYAALSQCNQTIVRSDSQVELFAKICEIAVNYGGMKMAWIGWLDTTTQQVIPISYYGAGTDYLDHTVIEMHNPSADGPTGTAMREDHPYYCQDFINDPSTVPWHERAKQYGWGASASLPIHSGGKVAGSFNIYSSLAHAFDDAAQRLLEEMVTDIDFALANFARQTEQRHTQLMTEQRTFMLELITSEKSLDEILLTVVQQVESIKPHTLCSILLLDADQQHLHVAAAPSLPDFYNAAIDGLAIGAGMGSCGNTAYTGQRTIADDIAHHPYWTNYLAIAQQANLAACWSEPIMGSQQKVLGTFALYHHTLATPSQNDMQLIEMLAHFIAIAIERKQDEANIHRLAHFDPLTHLPNRLLLEDRAHQAISVAQRAGTQLAVLFLDLDHFKNVNDNLGHRIGDILLIELAQRLQTLIRDEDTVSRLGGDEFIFVLPDTHPDAAAHVAEKLLAATAHPYQIQ